MHSRGSHFAISSALCALLLGVAACQTLSLVTGEDEGAKMRGRETAQNRCAGCHAVGRSGTSPRVDAPTFVDLRRRYSSPALLRELEASNLVGHYGMPITPTSAAERAGLVAYVESLQRRPKR